MMEQKCTMRNNSEFYSEQETKKKCTGKSGESGDIAKNVNIAILKNDIALFALFALLYIIV